MQKQREVTCRLISVEQMYIKEKELRNTLFWGRLYTTKAGMVHVQNTQVAPKHCTSAFHVILYVFYTE